MADEITRNLAALHYTAKSMGHMCNTLQKIPALLCTVCNYRDVIMSAMASQITSIPIVCSAVCSGGDQTTYQSSALLAFVRGIHRWQVDSRHKIFPFDDVIIYSFDSAGEVMGHRQSVCWDRRSELRLHCNPHGFIHVQKVGGFKWHWKPSDISWYQFCRHRLHRVLLLWEFRCHKWRSIHLVSWQLVVNFVVTGDTGVCTGVQ